MTLLTHGGSLLWALLVVWHAVGKGGSLLWALLCGVREARQHTVARRRAPTIFSMTPAFFGLPRRTAVVFDLAPSGI